MENYRTFVGIPVKVDGNFLKVRDRLKLLLDGERISWVNPENYHVTLRFIGETDPGRVKSIGAALREQVTIPGKTETAFGQAGSFGPRKKPRVVWLGFEENEILASMKHEVDKALVTSGISLPDQEFRAHITLGRVRSLKDPELFYRTIREMKDRFSGRVLLEELILYRSEPGSGGPVYTPLEVLHFEV
ncbi:MAG: RNA 2',3'-cyclic phosphodiesterase [Bacteroidota bacterium]